MSESDAQMTEMLRRRIECPVHWCEGRWVDHGGDGSAPEDWEHSDEGIRTAHGGVLFRSQLGTGQSEWSLAVGGQVVASSSDLGRLSAQLRNIADDLDRCSESPNTEPPC